MRIELCMAPMLQFDESRDALNQELAEAHSNIRVIVLSDIECRLFDQGNPVRVTGSALVL